MYVYMFLHENIHILTRIPIGLKLSMVSDVMQLVPLPKVICVLKAWKGDDDKTSVIENEVLVVKQVS